MATESINFLEAVKQEAEIVGSRFKTTIPAIDSLWEFMDNNEWFGVEHTGAGREIRIESIEPFKPRLDLWLKAYGKSRSEKIDLMLEAYSEVFPCTCEIFRRFIRKRDCKEKDSTWKLLDFLLATLKDEISSYDEIGIRSLIMQANRELTITGMHQLVDFLETSGREKWNYEFRSRRIVESNISAYSLEQFSIMAYTIFNEEAWSEHDLVRKATEKRKYADLWLFTALHFTGAMRKTDISRLPIPDLPYPPAEIRERILHGMFSGLEARAISEELLFRLEMKPLKPNKTRRSKNVPDIKLSIAESVLEPMGIILALSLSWRQPEDPFVSANMDLIDLRSFFGLEFTEALGNKRFSSRRANKSYLQGIEVVADQDIGSKPKGYILAALARSHKGGIGKLAEITDVYLKDANFSGYKPEFILREMFERGIFGFIPALLLEKYAGREYLKLNVSKQTELIKELGLNALQLEGITSCVIKSFQKSKSIVELLFCGQGSDSTRIGRTLQNIATGSASSKQDEFLCLRTAAGLPCAFPNRMGCVGCENEIYTKSATHLLMKEYSRINHEMINVDSFARMRLKNILEKGIMPAIAEIMSSIPMLYPDSVMEPIYEIVERGIADAGRTSC